ncbi:MAG TPA: UDP-N-acetylmuramate dehydrogenase [Flavitalea sp.]|nr:UDP-N-acetylmuramate dehydrogenase [Flavitalea sp.]
MKVFEQFDLTDYNSYRVKSTCARAFMPENNEDVRSLFHSASTSKPVVIGGGYNIILSKEYYTEDFVIFSENMAQYRLDGNRIIAQPGVSLLTLSLFALEHSLKGMEIYYDIPSSLGGAVVMNAGASGEEIKDILEEVTYFDPIDNSFHTIHRSELTFEYRNSFFQKNPHLVIAEAVLSLTPGVASEIREKMETIKAARWAKQPKDLPNAGSVFKRPPGKFVGPMIEELGLKGFSIGGAQISQKHAGFIVNFDHASGKDILEIIQIVKERVMDKFGVNLEIEQRII